MRKEESPPPRSGSVALVGRPNVGKSTLLNAAVGQALAIVSPVPQTTRDRILGVLHRRGVEMLLLDTPGLHRPESELGRALNRAAREAAHEADVVVFVTDVPSRSGVARAHDGLSVHPGDRTLLADIGKDKPTVLVINKVDRLKSKERLLPLLEELGKIRDFAASIPVSALEDDGIERVLDEIAPLLPERPFTFGPDDLTDRPIRFFAAEYVREQILRVARKEVPHATAVEIERFDESMPVVRIEATIHVEREGQRRILIGERGSLLKTIGTGARLAIEKLLGRRVHLALWVRVSPGWTQSPERIAELVYGKAGAR